jgi:hypothetical protein
MRNSNNFCCFADIFTVAPLELPSPLSAVLATAADILVSCSF